jgi:hypothetical protein
MKSRFFIISCTLALLIIASCADYWDNHYGAYPETVDQNVWEAMQSNPEISVFVGIMKQLQYDTLFSSHNTYTIFVPTNNALSQGGGTSGIDTSVINYHIATHHIQSGNIGEKQKVQTLSRKFALFERIGSLTRLDGIRLNFESPLYRNGKYFTMEQLAAPLPNFYQFYALNNPVLKDYIDLQDSIILDRERSKPIGFDEEGNTVYDTVSIVFNKFEAKYFPVKQEFRNRTATIVFPLQEDYRAALNIMADNMKVPGITNYSHIPVEWQNEILIPHLLEQGVFANMLEPEEFVWKSEIDTLKLKNILGDSIQIFYKPIGKTLLSNGYAYNYTNYEIPDSLYLGGTRFEVEWLLRETGANRFAWKPEATVRSDQPFAPIRDYIATASNDSLARVMFPLRYAGRFSLEFETRKLFPRRYIMVVATHMDIGGLYDIYVNDELVRSFNYYQFITSRGIMPSVVPGQRYLPVGRFNRFDMYVDNIHEYDKAKIRFEYRGPANVPSNGLVLDYIEFIPVAN